MLFLNYRIFYSRIVQNSLIFGRFTFYLYFCKFFMIKKLKYKICFFFVGKIHVPQFVSFVVEKCSSDCI